MKEITLLFLAVAATAGCGSLMPDDIKFKMISPSQDSRPNDLELYDPFQVTR